MFRRQKREWKKLTSGLYVPPYLRFATWYPFCGEGCEHCSGATPSQWRVVTAGIVDDTCADCDPDLNDTWILDQDLDISSAAVEIGCAYSYTLPSPICGVTCIVGFYAHDAAGYYWGVLFTNACALGSNIFHFNGPASVRQPTKPACAFNNEEFPGKSEISNDCDLSSASCHVTAL